MIFRLYERSVCEMSYKVRSSTLSGELIIQVILCDGLQTFSGDKLKDLVIMPFTGVHDSTGKAIYEFDIVDTGIGKFLVKFCKDCGSFQCFYPFDNDLTCFSCEGDYHWYELMESVESGDVKVIGNLFENSELLEE